MGTGNSKPLHKHAGRHASDEAYERETGRAPGEADRSTVAPSERKGAAITSAAEQQPQWVGRRITVGPFYAYSTSFLCVEARTPEELELARHATYSTVAETIRGTACGAPTTTAQGAGTAVGTTGAGTGQAAGQPTAEGIAFVDGTTGGASGTGVGTGPFMCTGDATGEGLKTAHGRKATFGSYLRKPSSEAGAAYADAPLDAVAAGPNVYPATGQADGLVGGLIGHGFAGSGQGMDVADDHDHGSVTSHDSVGVLDERDLEAVLKDAERTEETEEVPETQPQPRGRGQSYMTGAATAAAIGGAGAATDAVSLEPQVPDVLARHSTAGAAVAEGPFGHYPAGLAAGRVNPGPVALLPLEPMSGLEAAGQLAFAEAGLATGAGQLTAQAELAPGAAIAPLTFGAVPYGHVPSDPAEASVHGVLPGTRPASFTLQQLEVMQRKLGLLGPGAAVSAGPGIAADGTVVGAGVGADRVAAALEVAAAPGATMMQPGTGTGLQTVAVPTAVAAPGQALSHRERLRDRLHLTHLRQALPSVHLHLPHLPHFQALKRRAGVTVFTFEVRVPSIGRSWRLRKTYLELATLHGALRSDLGRALPDFPGRPWWLRTVGAVPSQEEACRLAKRLRAYLLLVLEIPKALEVSHALREFLELGRRSLDLELGWKGKEGYLLTPPLGGSSAARGGGKRGAGGSKTLRGQVYHPCPGLDCVPAWCRYWVSVRDGYIAVFEDSDATEPVHVVMIDQAFTVRPALSSRVADCGLVGAACVPGPNVQPSRDARMFTMETEAGVLLLQANSRKEADDWLLALSERAANAESAQWAPLGSFAPPRRAMKCRWLVDGRNTFAAMLAALRSATSEILITGWWITPDMALLREEEGDTSELFSDRGVVGHGLQGRAHSLGARHGFGQGLQGLKGRFGTSRGGAGTGATGTEDAEGSAATAEAHATSATGPARPRKRSLGDMLRGRGHRDDDDDGRGPRYDHDHAYDHGYDSRSANEGTGGRAKGARHGGSPPAAAAGTGGPGPETDIGPAAAGAYDRVDVQDGTGADAAGRDLRGLSGEQASAKAKEEAVGHGKHKLLQAWQLRQERKAQSALPAGQDNIEDAQGIADGSAQGHGGMPGASQGSSGGSGSKAELGPGVGSGLGTGGHAVGEGHAPGLHQESRMARGLSGQMAGLGTSDGVGTGIPPAPVTDVSQTAAPALTDQSARAAIGPGHGMRYRDAAGGLLAAAVSRARGSSDGMQTMAWQEEQLPALEQELQQPVAVPEPAQTAPLQRQPLAPGQLVLGALAPASHHEHPLLGTVAAPLQPRSAQQPRQVLVQEQPRGLRSGHAPSAIHGRGQAHHFRSASGSATDKSKDGSSRRTMDKLQLSALKEVLRERATAGVRIRVLMYQEVEAALPLNSAYQKKVLAALHPNIAVMRHGSWFWSHHEKICIIDRRLAFAGGLDMAWGRWDTGSHILDDADRRYVRFGVDYYNAAFSDYAPPGVDKVEPDRFDRSRFPRMPWHDVHMCMRGPAVSDMVRHFVQRWNFTRADKAKWHLPVMLPFPSFEPPRALQAAQDAALGSRSIGTQTSYETTGIDPRVPKATQKSASAALAALAISTLRGRSMSHGGGSAGLVTDDTGQVGVLLPPGPQPDGTQTAGVVTAERSATGPSASAVAAVGNAAPAGVISHTGQQGLALAPEQGGISRQADGVERCDADATGVAEATGAGTAGAASAGESEVTTMLTPKGPGDTGARMPDGRTPALPRGIPTPAGSASNVVGMSGPASLSNLTSEERQLVELALGRSLPPDSDTATTVPTTEASTGQGTSAQGKHTDPAAKPNGVRWNRIPHATTEWYCSTDWTQHWHTCNVQVCRSVGNWSAGVGTESSIFHAYVHAILAAKHSIYIENQYILSSLGWTDEEVLQFEFAVGTGPGDTRAQAAVGKQQRQQKQLPEPAGPLPVGDGGPQGLAQPLQQPAALGPGPVVPTEPRPSAGPAPVPAPMGQQLAGQPSGEAEGPWLPTDGQAQPQATGLAAVPGQPQRQPSALDPRWAVYPAYREGRDVNAPSGLAAAGAVAGGGGGAGGSGGQGLPAVADSSARATHLGSAGAGSQGRVRLRDRVRNAARRGLLGLGGGSADGYGYSSPGGGTGTTGAAGLGPGGADTQGRSLGIRRQASEPSLGRGSLLFGRRAGTGAGRDAVATPLSERALDGGHHAGTGPYAAAGASAGTGPAIGLATSGYKLAVSVSPTTAGRLAASDAPQEGRYKHGLSAAVEGVGGRTGAGEEAVRGPHPQQEYTGAYRDYGRHGGPGPGPGDGPIAGTATRHTEPTPGKHGLASLFDATSSIGRDSLHRARAKLRGAAAALHLRRASSADVEGRRYGYQDGTGQRYDSSGHGYGQGLVSGGAATEWPSSSMGHATDGAAPGNGAGPATGTFPGLGLRPVAGPGPGPSTDPRADYARWFSAQHEPSRPSRLPRRRRGGSGGAVLTTGGAGVGATAGVGTGPGTAAAGSAGGGAAVGGPTRPFTLAAGSSRFMVPAGTVPPVHVPSTAAAATVAGGTGHTVAADTAALPSKVPPGPMSSAHVAPCGPYPPDWSPRQVHAAKRICALWQADRDMATAAETRAGMATGATTAAHGGGPVAPVPIRAPARPGSAPALRPPSATDTAGRTQDRPRQPSDQQHRRLATPLAEPLFGEGASAMRSPSTGGRERWQHAMVAASQMADYTESMTPAADREEPKAVVGAGAGREEQPAAGRPGTDAAEPGAGAVLGGVQPVAVGPRPLEPGPKPGAGIGPRPDTGPPSDAGSAAAATAPGLGASADALLAASGGVLQWDPARNSVFEALFIRLCRAIEKAEDFCVTILLPLHPDGPIRTSRAIQLVLHWEQCTIAKGPHSLLGRLAAKFPGVDLGKYINFVALRNHARMANGSWSTEIVYVHSKLCIVDDRLVIVGSANINDRSMYGDRDSEIAVVISGGDRVMTRMAGRPWRASAFAHTLRRNLMEEHLGLAHTCQMFSLGSKARPAVAFTGAAHHGGGEAGPGQLAGDSIGQGQDKGQGVWTSSAHGGAAGAGPGGGSRLPAFRVDNAHACGTPMRLVAPTDAHRRAAGMPVRHVDVGSEGYASAPFEVQTSASRATGMGSGVGTGMPERGGASQRQLAGQGSGAASAAGGPSRAPTTGQNPEPAAGTGAAPAPIAAPGPAAPRSGAVQQSVSWAQDHTSPGYAYGYDGTTGPVPETPGPPPSAAAASAYQSTHASTGAVSLPPSEPRSVEIAGGGTSTADSSGAGAGTVGQGMVTSGVPPATGAVPVTTAAQTRTGLPSRGSHVSLAGSQASNIGPSPVVGQIAALPAVLEALPALDGLRAVPVAGGPLATAALAAGQWTGQATSEIQTRCPAVPALDGAVEGQGQGHGPAVGQGLGPDGIGMGIGHGPDTSQDYGTKPEWSPMQHDHAQSAGTLQSQASPSKQLLVEGRQPSSAGTGAKTIPSTGADTATDTGQATGPGSTDPELSFMSPRGQALYRQALSSKDAILVAVAALEGTAGCEPVAELQDRRRRAAGLPSRQAEQLLTTTLEGLQGLASSAAVDVLGLETRAGQLAAGLRASGLLASIRDHTVAGGLQASQHSGLDTRAQEDMPAGLTRADGQPHVSVASTTRPLTTAVSSTDLRPDEPPSTSETSSSSTGLRPDEPAVGDACALDALLDPADPSGAYSSIWVAAATNNARIYATVFPGAIQDDIGTLAEWRSREALPPVHPRLLDGLVGKVVLWPSRFLHGENLTARPGEVEYLLPSKVTQ